MKLISLIVGLSMAGCLSSSHRISNNELLELSYKDPNARGQNVRVVQNLGDNEAPPAPQGRVGANTVVIVNQPIWIGGTPRHHRHRPPPRSQAPLGAGPNKGLGSGGQKRPVADNAKDSAVALLVLAGVAAGALTLTEGLRYDGWVGLHPMHPVHLYGPYGEYTWMPLADLTPQAAQWASRAYVRNDEGPFQLLQRAPLNRRGWNYSFMLGGGQVALTQGGTNPGFQSHLELGYFPTHHFGILLDLGYGWTEQSVNGTATDTVFEKRTALNLQYLPLDAGKIYLGGYGTLGVSGRADDLFQVATSSGFWGGGALLQLELTTRLALTARAGMTFAYDESLSELLLGVSIY